MGLKPACSEKLWRSDQWVTVYLFHWSKRPNAFLIPSPLLPLSLFSSSGLQNLPACLNLLSVYLPIHLIILTWTYLFTSVGGLHSAALLKPATLSFWDSHRPLCLSVSVLAVAWEHLWNSLATLPLELLYSVHLQVYISIYAVIGRV